MGKASRQRRWIADETEALRAWQMCQEAGRTFVFCPIERGDHLGKDKPIRGTDVYRIVAQTEAISGDAARDRAGTERIERVFQLNMGIFRFKFTMNFLMNISTQLQIIGALLVGGWSVYTEQLEIGGVVAFISGIGRITDPWGDLVNYFRDVNITQVKFRLLRDAVNQQAQRNPPTKTRSPATGEVKC